MRYIFPILLGSALFLLSSFVFNTTQSILIGIVFMLVAFWTNEALPLGVVSLLPIILFPLFHILDLKDVSLNYSKSIIFLFLGGFILAIAVEKINLHKVIAAKLISIFPKTKRGVVFALSITSSTLSAFLSNTTTALLLLPIALFLTEDKILKARFVLAIAYGASIGGILTPIGTPPNLILYGFLDDYGLSKLTFIEWMFKTAPLVFIMLIIVSFILSIGLDKEKIEFKESYNLNKEQKRLSFILGVVVVFLFLNSFIKIPDALILLSFALLMFIPKIGFLTWDDTKKIPYEIIFLFGAGFSIAMAFSKTGLALEISKILLNLNYLTPILLLFAIAFIITFSTEITSNTALTAIALPIIYEVARESVGVDERVILMLATICASYAFMLPIATPPNAIAMSSGVLNVKTMMKFGFLFNIIAIILTTLFAYFYW